MLHLAEGKQTHNTSRDCSSFKSTRLPALDKKIEDIQSYRKELFSRALYYTAGNKDLAEDLTQESLLSGIQNIHMLQDEKLIRGWLQRILYNRFISQTRSPHIRKSISMDEEGIDARDKTDYQEKLLSSFDKQIIDYFSDTRINEGYRELLKDYYLEEMSIRQIAELRERSHATIHSKLTRAQRKLRSLIESDRMTRRKEEEKLFSEY